MHTCLNVDEIVRLIAGELVASEAKVTAVTFACCRKGYEDPVLDALWKTQRELLPLLKSLPGGVWNDVGCTVSAPTTHFYLSLNTSVRKTFKRLPTTPEWARFRKYARRMRQLRGLCILDDLSKEVFSVLQLCAINESLFPNMRSLNLWPAGKSISFVPLFLSPRITVISITCFGLNLPKPMIASMIAAFPTLCPNLQEITLQFLPRGPMITAAVSGMLLASNRNGLRRFRVDSPLTEEARQVVYKLPNLRDLSVVIEKDSSLPPVVLPNLTSLTIKYGDDNDSSRVSHGTTLENFGAVTFHSGSEQIGGLLEAFERLTLAASTQNTLSELYLYTSSPWNPNYASLLPFIQMTALVIDFSCLDGCSSTVNDDVITNLARAMPKLGFLKLGHLPCREFPTGVTAKGLVVLARHCPTLSSLRIHFRVDSLCAPPTISGLSPDAGPSALRRDCALKYLEVGEIPVPEELVSVVALTLSHIFPRIEGIDCDDGNWDKVVKAIRDSREVVEY